MIPRSGNTDVRPGYERGRLSRYSRHLFLLGLIAVSLAVVPACSRGGEETRLPSQNSATNPAEAARAVISLSRPPDMPPELSSDVLWVMAARGDELDAAALAEREGAIRLLERLEQGGKAGEVALLALPLAPDIPAARGRICELASRIELGRREFFLRQLEAALSPRKNGDAWIGEPAPPHADVCREALQQVIRDPGARAAELDLAQSALAHLPVARAAHAGR